MAKASFYIPSFYGGEWSVRAQGAIEDPRYKTAMNKCLNAFPVEEGAWVRRPCWQFIGTTHKGYPGKLLSIPAQNNSRALVELTYGASAAAMRIWVPPNTTVSGTLLGDYPYTLYCDAYDTVSAFSTASPAQITTAAAHAGWATGDTVVLFRANGGTIAAHQFIIAKVDSTHFTLTDPVTGFGIDGTKPEYNSVAFVGHVKVFVTADAPLPTTLAKVQSVRACPSDAMCFLLQHNTRPGFLKATYSSGVPTYTYTDPQFEVLDGPYIDPSKGASQTGYSPGTITIPAGQYRFTVTDGSYAFVAGDLTRAIRLWNQPPAWASGTSYNSGDQVTYNNAFWKMSKTGVAAGVAPGQSYVSGGVSYLPWELAPAAGYWAYGNITIVVSSTTVEMQLSVAPNLNGNTIDTWQLGVWTVDQQPSCGCWADGRLWFAGALLNRIDGSVAGINKTFFDLATGISTSRPVWAPTDLNGNVLDDSALAETLNSPDTNDIYWLAPDEGGVVVGTAGGEWLVSASTSDEVMTPTNVKARQKTRFAVANCEAVRTGPALVFVQGYLRKIFEYLTDAFTQRFTGRPVNLAALHLFGSSVSEITYQEDLQPILWARDAAGLLYGCTYRRISRWATEPPQVYGWHQHTHGGGKKFESICAASRGASSYYSSIAGITTDSLSDTTKPRYIEVLAPMIEVARMSPLAAYHTDETLCSNGLWGSDAIAGGGGGTPVGASGKFYQEFTVNTISSGSSGGQPMAVGVAGYNQLRATGFTLPRTATPGVGAQECVVFAHNGDVWTSNAHTASGAATYSAGDRIAIRANTVAKTVAFRNVTTASAWSSDYTTSGINSTAGLFVFFCGTGFSGTDDVTLIAPGSESGTIPATFVAWGSTVWSTSVQSFSYLTASLNAVFSASGRRAAIGPGVTTGAPSNIPSPNSVGTNYFNVGIPRVGSPPNDDAWQAGYIGILATGGKASP